MNQTYAKILLIVFLISAAVFNIARGRKQIRSKRESTFWGWIRILVGISIALLPFPLLWWLHRT